MTAVVRKVRQLANALRARLADDDTERRVGLTGFFRAEEIDWVCQTYFEAGAVGDVWVRVLKDAHLSLPSWFEQGHDPFGERYAQQQHRLWQLVSGIDRAYEAEVHEKEHSWADVDPVRSPGFFLRRDPQAVANASDHVLATGMLLKHCDLKPGDRALEYGAGFGHTALTLARLGVSVDTVDISATFCEFIRQQAEFFRVSLTPFEGRFGFNPRPGQRYHAIWFYESFHHCVDFLQVVHQLHDLLEPGGKILLGGEPIVEREYAAVPFPWGVRLHSEVVAVVRRQGWFELGFSEDFLFELFTNAGFVAKRIDCDASLFGRLYVFEKRGDEVEVGSQWLPTGLADEWHGPEPDGRWTRGVTTLPVDATNRFSALEVVVSNRHRWRQRVEVGYGNQRSEISLMPGEEAGIRFDALPGTRRLGLASRTRRPAWLQRLKGGDGRELGVFVRRIRYLPSA